MKLPNANFNAIKDSRAVKLLLLSMVLAAPVHAQDNAANAEDRQIQRQERREKMLAEHPVMAERMAERQAEMEAKRAEREEFLLDNPEAAALVEERRSLMERHQAELEAWRSEFEDYLDANPEAREFLQDNRQQRGPGFRQQQQRPRPARQGRQ